MAGVGARVRPSTGAGSWHGRMVVPGGAVPKPLDPIALSPALDPCLSVMAPRPVRAEPLEATTVTWAAVTVRMRVALSGRACVVRHPDQKESPVTNQRAHAC